MELLRDFVSKRGASNLVLQGKHKQGLKRASGEVISPIGTDVISSEDWVGMQTSSLCSMPWSLRGSNRDWSSDFQRMSLLFGELQCMLCTQTDPGRSQP